jgi:hypothetical protein
MRVSGGLTFPIASSPESTHTATEFEAPTTHGAHALELPKPPFHRGFTIPEKYSHAAAVHERDEDGLVFPEPPPRSFDTTGRKDQALDRRETQNGNSHLCCAVFRPRGRFSQSQESHCEGGRNLRADSSFGRQSLVDTGTDFHFRSRSAIVAGSGRSVGKAYEIGQQSLFGRKEPEVLSRMK